MQVCVPSTPGADVPHAAAADAAPFRKPLIVMTPKSLLRHELSVSPLEDLTRGSFARVIDEIDDLRADSRSRRVVFCSGKVYFDLLKARRKDGLRDVAIVRIEQLYPFPTEEYEAVLQQISQCRARSCGARKSRRTRAPGIRSAIACRRRWRPPQQVLYAGRAPRRGAGHRHLQDARSRAARARRGRAACDCDRGVARETTRLSRRPGADARRGREAPRRHH